MKRILSLSLLSLSLIVNSCADSQAQNANLPVKEFAQKLEATKGAILIDVRTPGEYAEGHLNGAQNIDWNGSEFVQQISKLDKSTPVFVYCRSGGRSSAAMNKLREEGFERVYNMDGGMMKWRSENLPETTVDATPKAGGMSKADYDKLLESDKIVLVDFNATWCGPCKKMKPFLEEIAAEMKDKVVIVSIDADENPALCQELSVDALPTIFVYKNKTMMWYNVGYTDKKTLVDHLK